MNEPPNTLRRRISVSLEMIKDIDTGPLVERYGGIDSTEHEDVQMLLAFVAHVRKDVREEIVGELQARPAPEVAPAYGAARRARYGPRSIQRP